MNEKIDEHLTDSEDVSEHIANKSNPHGVTKEQLGLGNVNIKGTDTAIGYGATVTNGGSAVGYNTKAENGGAVGSIAKTTSGGAVGYNATSTSGAAVGYAATTSNGVAVGYAAMTMDATGKYIDAIQLGTGTNPTPKTLQIYNYPLLDALGKIPDARLPFERGSYVGNGTGGIGIPFNKDANMIIIQSEDATDDFGMILGICGQTVTPIILTKNSTVAHYVTIIWDYHSVFLSSTDGNYFNKSGVRYVYMML